MRERHLLRRERLHRVLHRLDFLPAHYDQSLGWNKDDNRTYGKFLADNESKLVWYTNKEGKSCFFFMDSFREMIEDFRSHHPHLLLPRKDGKLPLIPYDWTIYYLRKKGLTAPLAKEEIAWLLLHFNQKRGYYQLRGEDEEKSGKREEYQLLKVAHVEKTKSAKKGDDEYIITFENGWSHVKRSKTPLFDWQGTTKEYIVTTSLGQDGQPKKDKEGNIQRLFRIPKEDDWTLIKKKTEMDVRRKQKWMSGLAVKQ